LSNPKDKDVEKEIPQHLLDLQRAYKSFFSTDDGQLVIYDLMKKGHFLSPTVGSSPEISNRNEGQRELVLYILEMTERDIVKTHKLMEQMAESQEDII